MVNWNSLHEEMEQLKREGRYRPVQSWTSASSTWMETNGRKLLQMSSNNYLGFADHPALRQAAIEAIQTYGVGSGSVRTITGTLAIHEQLEFELARFKGTEAALTFQSGFTTNQGVLSTILGADDVVISDELNHASIIDGIRLTKAHRKIYTHKNMDQLEQALRESALYKKRVVVTDGVFSMDGDIAPLQEIVELAERYDAFVYVDDAHASGVLGRNGKGSVDHFGLNGRVHMQIGTLSKAVGVVGGYVACENILKETLIHKARPFLFSTSQPPMVAAACLAAIRLLEQSDELIQRLWSNADYFRKGVQALGLDTGASETPIVPVIIGSPEKTMIFSDMLLQEGIFAQGITYPTVAMDKGRVRMIVTANHTREELDFVIQSLEKVGRKTALI
ncbi:glycine C-acetyltransferase [Paenibacillus spongiae]|uniref:8-amino-7-ketopelargonate synthase n=1 Tax=Paenibacillus spongiae TaxID=2909671 RepID=A0ABY5SH44_9BACL|nr:glycine C-acetyltransferase [Paenibacillus spongiae]UVI33322.1 glycine C-acetyltransferase [Paenibacillus spongiae]